MNNFSPLAIAAATFRGFVRDRIFYGVLIFSLLFIALSYLIATLTITEERKILLDFGFMAISLSGISVAIFLGTTAVAKEIESRVIYSVLSKPISRAQYLLGKFLGTFAILFVAHALLSATLIGILLFLGQGFPDGLFACFFLMLLESLLILAIASAFSVYSSAFLSGSFSFAIFLAGRSSSTLKLLAEKATTPGTRSIAKFFYWFLPNLERFNIRDLVAYSKPYPHNMLPLALAYCLLYSIFVFSLGAAAFAKRDLP